MAHFRELMETKPEKRPFLEVWEEVGCSLCDGKTKTMVVWPDALRGNIVRCRQCGLVYRSPRRREDYLTQHFESEWTEARSAFQLEDYRTENLRRIVKWVLKKHPSPGTVLDIGSSYGALLAQFPKTWQLVGVEPSVTACQIARERLPGATIINATLGDAVLPEKSFDVIIMVDTIYYLPHPVRDLGGLPGLLRPGGIILIEAPNFNNRGWVYQWVKHHFDETWMYFYTPRTLQKLLNKSGLDVIERFDLPGHRVGSPNFWARLITKAEFAILKAVKKSTRDKLDLSPHFALAARAK